MAVFQPPARLPAEWEPQDGVLLAWPHEETDWKPILKQVEPVFADIIKDISRFERAIVVAPPEAKAAEKIAAAGAVMKNVALYHAPANDTWARDFGPITVYEGDKATLLDYGFNGWGLKFAANHDNQITRRLHEAGLFGSAQRRTMGLILEGGSIESDGRGTLLTTAECLLNGNRNPHLSRTDIQDELSRDLGGTHFLWLENGYLAGDDTDSHIDTLARICPKDTILYVECDDPADEHFPALQAMASELAAFRTQEGKPYRLIPLPWPKACYDDEGQRLPATYANFLVINGAVLVPTYQDRRDAEAIEAIRKAFPDREIIGIDCLPLIWQHGSLHCVTMQIPKGTMKE